MASAVTLATSVLLTRSSLYPAHIREILSSASWKYTECDGKYSTRFRSEGAMVAKTDAVHHEHVINPKVLLDRLLANPDQVRKCLLKPLDVLCFAPNTKCWQRTKRQTRVCWAEADFEELGSQSGACRSAIVWCDRNRGQT